MSDKKPCGYAYPWEKPLPGLEELYGPKTPEARERLAKELADVNNESQDRLPAVPADTEAASQAASPVPSGPSPEGSLLPATQEPEAGMDTLIPCDPVPYNDMAALFGAAATVLAINPATSHITRAELRKRLSECFRYRDQQFRDRAEQIVLAYAANNHNPLWDAACRVRARLLEHGYDGFSTGPIYEAARRAAGDLNPDAVYREVIRKFYPHIGGI